MSELSLLCVVSAVCFFSRVSRGSVVSEVITLSVMGVISTGSALTKLSEVNIVTRETVLRGVGR